MVVAPLISISVGISGWLAAPALAAGSSPVGYPAWGTNGIVDAVLPMGKLTYVGGLFTEIGPFTGGGASIDRTTGRPVGRLPVVGPVHEGLTLNGDVQAAVPDRHGGYYIGGLFRMIGGIARSDLAHVRADGSVDPVWHPSANSFVEALAVSGSTVYAGGWFTSIDGHRRNHVVALDARTGRATSWNPSTNGYVETLAVSGSTVYAGGYFTRVNGAPRHYVAALNARSGRLTAWNPSAAGKLSGFTRVSALAVSGSTVYAGGLFTSIGGHARPYLAALDARTGNATAWNPGANGGVSALAISGSTVYAGGLFTSIGGHARRYLAALGVRSGRASAWSPAPDGAVLGLAVAGPTVYAAGSFTRIGGRARPSCRIKREDGPRESLDPERDWGRRKSCGRFGLNRVRRGSVQDCRCRRP
ncbi:MAG: outer membrane protein assembly factor BamB family protein [Solirubrobacteraceae bacterium]